MHFTCNIYYEGREEHWGCRECGLMMNDKEDFTPEFLSKTRKFHRQILKEGLAKAEGLYLSLKQTIGLYGRYMNDEEKVRLLAERLEGEG